MAEYSDSLDGVWAIAPDGHIDPNQRIGSSYNCVRPVVTLKKTALGDVDESIKDDSDSQDIVDSDGADSDTLEDKVLAKEEPKSSMENNEVSVKVKVENTYMSQTLIVMIIGFISICSGVVIYYLIKNKKVISRR